MSNARDLDFGYSWVWEYGHLVPTALLGASLGIALVAGAPIWVWLPLSALAVWTFSGFLISRFLFRVSAPLYLPSATFLASGAGSVLDIGCGSGRTSIMVGQARPQATITALDDFRADYIEGHGEAKTLRNFKAAGIDRQSVVQQGDMRSLPFANRIFDAAVSSYAIDHLEPQDVPAALSEAYRVLRPGGEFLLMVIVPNVWTVLAFSPVIFLKFPSRQYWRQTLGTAGFPMVAEGSSRGAAWFLLRKNVVETPAGEVVLEKSHSGNPGALPTTTQKGNARKRHSFSLHGVIVPVALAGLAILLVAVGLRLLGVYVSWWWVVAAIPIGMHVGVFILVLAVLLRWLKRAWAGKRPLRQQ